MAFFNSCCFADEVKIQIELDASLEDMDDAEADKLLFGGAKVRECELKENKILTLIFQKLVKTKRGQTFKTKIQRVLSEFVVNQKY